MPWGVPKALLGVQPLLSPALLLCAHKGAPGAPTGLFRGALPPQQTPLFLFRVGVKSFGGPHSTLRIHWEIMESQNGVGWKEP